MKPIDYLTKIEPINVLLFEAVLAADLIAEAERGYLKPQYEYHAFEFNRNSATEENDNLKLAELRESIVLINTGGSSAAGAILQTSKQCISMAWNDEERFSKGRKIGTQYLSSVIWHARNQALHFEEGVSTNPKTRECITLLESDVGLDVRDLGGIPRSLAREILIILKWENYESYARDMVNMLEMP